MEPMLVAALRRLDRMTRTWGSTAEERSRRYPCDEVVSAPDIVCWRALDVEAAPEAVFRWLAQLRVAPYSYDWIDNFGRRSPRRLTPGLGELERGQRFMGIFRLVDLDPGRQLTLRTDRTTWAFGEIAVTYGVEERAPASCRLVVKLVGRSPGGLRGLPWRFLAAPADLVMMRKQLLTLKALAEDDTRRRVASPSWQTPRTSLLPPPR